MSVWLPGVEKRRGASRTPAEANMNVLEEADIVFMELPTPARVGNSHDIGVLVAVICAKSHSALAMAEVDLPCDGDQRLYWTALRGTSRPSEDKLKRWEKSIRRLLDGVLREDRGRRD